MMIKNLDLTNPTTIFYIRIAFCVGAAITLGMLAMIYLSIQNTNDQRRITIKKSNLQPASPFAAFTQTQTPAVENQAEETEQMTVQQYDMLNLKQHAQQALTTFGIVSAMHLYGGYVPPLFLQSYMLPMNVSQSELTKIHLLKHKDTDEGLTRPFGVPQAAEIQEPTNAAAASNNAVTTTSTSDDATTDSASASTSSNTGARKRR